MSWRKKVVSSHYFRHRDTICNKDYKATNASGVIAEYIKAPELEAAEI